MLAVLVLFIVLVCFWWARVLRSPQQYTFTSWDLFVYFQPLYMAISDAFHQGRVPLWNPHQGCGEPLLAVLQGGVFYPVRLLTFAMDPAQAMGWTAFIHLAIAAAGMFACVRALGASVWAGLVASITFTYGFAAQGIYQPATYLEPGVWLPVAAFAIYRIAATGEWRYVALASVSMAAPIIAGGYQISLYSMYAIASVCIGLWSDRETRSAALARRPLGLLLLAGVFAVALSAVQWAPTLLWATQSMRSTGALSTLRVDPYHAPPAIVMHALLGRRTELNGMFFPLCVVPLALIGTILGPRRIMPIIALALVSLCLSLGPTLPWFSLYYVLPGFAMFRAPVRLHYLVIFGGAIAAGFGLDVIRRWARQRNYVQNAIVTAGIGTVCVVILFAPVSGAGEYLGRGVDRYDWFHAGATLASAFLSPPLVGPVVTTAVTSATIARRANNSLLPYSRRGLDLLGTHQKTYRTLARHAGLWRTLFVTPGVSSLAPAFAIKQATLTGLYAPDDYEPLAQSRLMNYLSVLIKGRPLEERDAWAGRIPIERDLAVPRLLDMASIKYVLAAGWQMKPELATMFDRYTPVRNVIAPVDARYVRVVENAEALPRAYIAGAIRTARDDDHALELIQDPQFDPKREVVAAGDESSLPESGADRPIRTALITSYEPERIVISARSDGTGALVLTDAYAPGWQAAVDGKPVGIWRANYLFRGVTLPDGDHEVVFTYSAPGYRAGLAAAVCAIAVLAAIPFVRWARTRQWVRPRQPRLDRP